MPSALSKALILLFQVNKLPQQVFQTTLKMNKAYPSKRKMKIRNKIPRGLLKLKKYTHTTLRLSQP